MADTVSPRERSRIMGQVKSANTSCERLVAAELRRRGVRRIRRHVRSLPGAPDFVLPEHRAIVLVQGCFWHGHDCPRGARIPATRRAYWLRKIGRNRTRDRRVARQLRELGWRVFHVWECRLKAKLLAATMSRLVSCLERNRDS